MSPDRRPRFHYTPPQGWMNDPVGITWHGGRYHLFFQHLPDSIAWQPGCHWGHATSPDLLTWETHPSALAPGDGDDGCWSGALGVSGGAATILYTSIADEWRVGRIRAATPVDDDWVDWAKGDVVAEAPAELDLHEFRDPFVFRDGDQWRMLVGAGFDDGTACALVYTSPSSSLTDWTYTGILASRDGALEDPVWTGHAWECPQLVEVDGRHVLIVSAWSADRTFHVAASVGAYADGRFEPGPWQRLTYGPGHYAASAFRDADGAPCVLMWVREVADADAGWAGAQSVPLRLSIEDGLLALRPHPAIEASGAARDQTDVAQAWDVDWRPGAGGSLVVASAEGRPLAELSVEEGTIQVITGGADAVALPWSRGPVRVVVDGPILEVVAAHTTYAAPLGTGGEPVRVTSR